MAITAQILTAEPCSNGKRNIRQCSGVRITNDTVATAYYCLYQPRDVFVLASPELMNSFRRLDASSSDIVFKDQVSCSSFDDLVENLNGSNLLRKVDRSSIIFHKELLDKTASIAKLERRAKSLALLKVDSAVLGNYRVLKPGAVMKGENHRPISIYGSGLTNCFNHQNGKIVRIPSSEMKQNLKEIGQGRVDAFSTSGQVRYSMLKKAYDVESLLARDDGQIPYVDGVMIFEQPEENFSCPGDGGGPVVDRQSGRVLGLYVANAQSKDSESDLGVVTTMVSKWSCGLLNRAGIAIPECAENSEPTDLSSVFGTVANSRNSKTSNSQIDTEEDDEDEEIEYDEGAMYEYEVYKSYESWRARKLKNLLWPFN